MPLDRRDFLKLGPAAMAVSAVVDRSLRSTGARAKAVDVPDVTRGRWRSTPPPGLVTV
jgi:hypothetical protein